MTSATTESGTGSAGAPSSPPKLTPLGWARWAWRHLTSMRTALILLFLLAIGAVPGSALPQRSVSTGQVQQYFVEHPDIAPWLDRLYLFDVYSSPWFAAIYLLLFVSLTGCVLPRAATHYRAMRARPPAAPRNLGRLPYSARFTTDADPSTALRAARRALKGYRIDSGTDSVAAEKGYLRETGNLLFHFALLALLIALAGGSFFGYRGNLLMAEGTGFANSVPSYDAFYPGSAIGASDLQPFSFTLQEFEASFVEEGSKRGQAESFSAQLTYHETPDSPEREHNLRVNHPLQVNGAQVYLIGHGYAPDFTVTDSKGNVVFDQAVPFLQRTPQTFTSDGVVKAPDSSPKQLGFTGVFLPTATENANGELVSTFPDPRDPKVMLEGFKGDLGLDSGEPQSVYQLATSQMTPIGESEPMSPGDTWELPDGGGNITFNGYSDYITLQINSNPARVPALLAASSAVAGLLCTLLVRQRRAWVRARTGEDGRTVVEVGGLSKTEGEGQAAEFHELATRLRDSLRSDSAERPRTEKD